MMDKVNDEVFVLDDNEKNIRDTDNKLSKSENGRRVNKTIDNFHGKWYFIIEISSQTLRVLISEKGE